MTKEKTEQSAVLPTGKAQPSQAPTIETAAYVPTYTVSPEFKQELLKSIGDRPFNEIAGLINAVNVPSLDHQTLIQVVNAIGQFPYVKVEKILTNINDYVTQIVED